MNVLAVLIIAALATWLFVIVWNWLSPPPTNSKEE